MASFQYCKVKDNLSLLCLITKRETTIAIAIVGRAISIERETSKETIPNIKKEAIEKKQILLSQCWKLNNWIAS